MEVLLSTWRAGSEACKTGGRTGGCVSMAGTSVTSDHMITGVTSVKPLLGMGYK